jgi:6-phosphogluconate dehydrogenase
VLKHSPYVALTIAPRSTERGPAEYLGCGLSGEGGAKPGDGPEVLGGGDDKAYSDRAGAWLAV